MRAYRLSLPAAAMLLLAAKVATANNLAITNVTLTAAGGGLAHVDFDVAWENSWRDALNYDAVWLFLKYSTDGGRRWQHATLAEQGFAPAGFLTGSQDDLEFWVPEGAKGAMLQRAADGTGAVDSQGARLVWNFDADGVSSNATATIRVFGIEMAYIPAGPFYVGDDTSRSAFMVTYINRADMALGTPESGNGTITNAYVNTTDGLGRPQGVTGNFHAAYPNGYNAFYLMKYEPTEGLYVDFLNTLSREQALSRFPDIAGVSRNTVALDWADDQVVRFKTSAPHRAMGYRLWGEAWIDAVALTAWAALRPATEMEFEKACRGPVAPVDRDYAWGTNAPAAYVALLDDGTVLERPAIAHARANYTTSSPQGPLRVGAFATNNADRVTAGAGYYGVMELSGNVMNRVISSGHQNRTGAAQVPGFSGEHGDGHLDAAGFFTPPTWPLNPDAGAFYSGRGGGWNHAIEHLAVAARFTTTQGYYYGLSYGGVRAALTAPAPIDN